MQSNPFATRFIQPGAIHFRRFDGGTLNDLAQHFLSLPSKRGGIIGPHGSGKSTLIASLINEFQSICPKTNIYSLRFSTGHSPLKSLNASLAEWIDSSIVVLDGFEQLGFWSRWKIERTATSRSIRLLATAHQPIRRFTSIWQTSIDETTSNWVVQQLLHQANHENISQDLLTSDDWTRSREKHRQNLRESLFDMYDWYQNRTHDSVDNRQA